MSDTVSKTKEINSSKCPDLRPVLSVDPTSHLRWRLWLTDPTTPFPVFTCYTQFFVLRCVLNLLLCYSITWGNHHLFLEGHTLCQSPPLSSTLQPNPFHTSCPSVLPYLRAEVCALTCLSQHSPQTWHHSYEDAAHAVAVT